MKKLLSFLSLFLFTSIFLTACGQGESTESGPDEATEPAAVTQAAIDESAIYATAVNSDARSDADRARDAGRKPGEVLAFFDIKPGMRVLDMFAGGGYYSELLSYVVGESGSVSAHSNEAYAQYVAEETMTRYGGDRLPNVQTLMAENNELSLGESEYDAVLLVLSFHDIFYVDPKNGWPKIDGPALLAELHKGLKPGGVIGIVDHYAEAGSARETGGTLHRIDPNIVVADMEAAGFVAAGKSEALRNMDDDYSMNMADPAVRGKTDRFVMKFRKPE
jgi:predicted methyltransferase